MPTLVIDTSLSQSHLALAAHSEVYRASIMDGSKQAEQLVSEIDGLLERAVVGYGALNAVYCTVGPGSFTGIRIGLAAVRALLLAFPALECYGISTLHAMAQTAAAQHRGLARFTVVNKAGKGECYTQDFEMKDGLAHAASKANLVAPDAVDASATVIGNGVALIDRAGQAIEITEIDAASLLQLPKEIMQPGAPVPLYIRAPDAEVSRKRL